MSTNLSISPYAISITKYHEVSPFPHFFCLLQLILTTPPFSFIPTLGRIASYGICSNSMANPGAPDHISLSQILDDLGHSAENFVAVESPFNLFERGVVGSGEGRDMTGVEMSLVKLAAVCVASVGRGQ